MSSQQPKRKVHGEGTYAHYVTFSCFKRRRLLNPDLCKRIVIGSLDRQLTFQNGICVGFVIMPEHVHALVWFPEEQQISEYMNRWKEFCSKQIKAAYAKEFLSYGLKVDSSDPVWQDRYYGFNVYSDSKLREKVEYMHNNPVRAGLVKEACDWPWSSARFWLQGKQVGIPLSWVS